MSILAEVLSNVNTVEIQNINEKVPELKIKIEDVKTQIVEYMENVYLNFGARPRENKKVFAEVQAMEEEIVSLKNSIESIRRKQLSEVLTSIGKHIIDLETINLKLSIVSRVCEINEQLVRYNALLESNEYFLCMKLIYDLTTLHGQITDNEHLQFLTNIILTIESKKYKLLDKLAIIFSEHIKVDCMNGNPVTLKIKKDSTILKKALMALYFDDSVISCLSIFASSLWQYFITPAVDNSVELDEKEDNNFVILEIFIDSSKTKPLYPKVFSNLQVVLKFLKAHFDFEIAENVSVMKLIGDDLRDNLYELIIKHCLEDTIPTTTEDLQNYKTVIQETEKFEKTLQTYDIFSEDSTKLKEYVQNVDIHYINKKCKQYLFQSDIIMKKDLHDMKEVGTPYNSDNLLDFPESELPQCCVSKSVLELICFLEEIMIQAASASEECAGQLLDTIKNIIIKYGHFVPQYHSKLLQTIPQQVALFQNNCLFINYELTKWKEKYYLRFPQKLVTAHYNTVEAAGQIKQIGVDCFKTYVSKTKDSLVIIGIKGPTLEDLSPETEKSIRQCMRQQELLKTVWHKVLSYSLYNKTMGVLLDAMCLNLINAIVCLEDISSKAAEQLVEVFKIVITRGPKLFTDPKEINFFVPSWYKFNELNFVLAASLVDINDRWADGKGPLALQFKANELKLLIRALFQNTDRRAAVLARIL